MLSGQAFGQSSLFNVPYRPQPRVLIPTVEPAQTLVSTNGTVIANTNRALRYCDFYLAAVDQSGAYTNPILFEFSSVTTNAQSAAVVFYQRSGANWPASLLRNAGSTYCVTNWTYAVVTNASGSYVAWQGVLSLTNYPSRVTWKGSNFVAMGSSAGMPRFYKNQYTAPTGTGSFEYVYSGSGTVWQIKTGASIAYNSPAFTNSIVTSTQETNFWTITYTTNAASEIQSATIMSVSATSSNEASAIEVYPLRQGQKWMKPANPDIKWMCLLSNGRGWYSTPAGDPVWFNCLVEWVDKIPTNGVR